MKENIKKIHIIGTSGSGKTHLSKKLSHQLGIPMFELDDIYWHNESGHSGVERSATERNALLESCLKNHDSWIIEGVYYKWVDAVFDSADAIIVLNPALFVRDWRILKRFLFAEQGRDRSLKAVWDNIIWGRKYVKNKLPIVMEITEKYKEKRIVISNKKQVDVFL